MAWRRRGRRHDVELRRRAEQSPDAIDEVRYHEEHKKSGDQYPKYRKDVREGWGIINRVEFQGTVLRA